MDGQANTYTVQNRRIILSQFAVDCEIGIHEFEKGKTQRVTIDVTLETAADADLSAIVDYDFVREGIFELVKAQQYDYQEQLCEDIANLCFSKPGVIAATVRSCKPDVYPDCDAVCYELHATKN